MAISKRDARKVTLAALGLACLALVGSVALAATPARTPQIVPTGADSDDPEQAEQPDDGGLAVSPVDIRTAGDVLQQLGGWKEPAEIVDAGPDEQAEDIEAPPGTPPPAQAGAVRYLGMIQAPNNRRLAMVKVREDQSTVEIDEQIDGKTVVAISRASITLEDSAGGRVDVELATKMPFEQAAKLVNAGLEARDRARDNQRSSQGPRGSVGPAGASRNAQNLTPAQLKSMREAEARRKAEANARRARQNAERDDD